MPEGPEIVITTQYLRSKLLGKSITSILVLSGRYTHQTMSGKKLIRKGHTYRIASIDSKGKLMWMTLQERKNNKSTGKTIYMANTLGMAGQWGFFKQSSSRTRFRICCEKSNKYNLYFTDHRNFGTIEFYDAYEPLETRIDSLAPDILTTGLSTNGLVELINDFIRTSKIRDKNIVKVLMNQNALVSGIGNYLVAEILYDAKISPHRSLADINSVDKNRLAYSMRKIVKLAYYDNKTGYMANYEDFMSKHPVKVDKRIFPNYHPDIKIECCFEFKVYGQETDPKGNKIKKDSIIKDRTIHWVPAIQK